jgi:hypothetical protein
VAVYLGCGSRGPWVTGVPVLALLGEADDITPPESCSEILARLPDSARAEVRRYAAARHGFDFTEGPEVLPIGGGMSVGRHPAAGEEAWEELFAFLGAPQPTLGEVDFRVSCAAEVRWRCCTVASGWLKNRKLPRDKEGLPRSSTRWDGRCGAGSVSIGP